MRMVRTCGPFSCACWRLPQSGCHLIFHVQPWPLICGVWISSVHPEWQHDVCFSHGLCPPKVCVGYPEDGAGRVSLWWRIPIKRYGLSMCAGWISTDGVLLFNGWQPYVAPYGMCRLLVHDLVCVSPKKNSRCCFSISNRPHMFHKKNLMFMVCTNFVNFGPVKFSKIK